MFDAEGLPESRRLRWADTTGFLSVLIIVFTGTWLGGTLHRAAWVLLLVAFLFALREFWPVLRRNWVFWISLAFIGYLGVRHGLSVYQYPPEVLTAEPRTRDFLRASPLFILMGALFVRDDPLRLRCVLVAALAGLVVWIGGDMDWQRLLSMDWDTRRLLSPDNPNRVAMAVSMALLGVLVFGVGAVARRWRRWGGPAVWIGTLAVTGLLAVTAGALVLTGSRQAWLGTLAGLVVALALLSLWQAAERGVSRSRALGIGFAVVALFSVAAVVGGAHSERAVDRATETLATVQQFVQDPEAASEDPISSSVEQRLRLPIEGVLAWSERPWLGWGAQTNHLVIHEITPGRSHFHNLYVEVLYALGGIGALLFFGAYTGVFAWGVTTVRRYRDAVLPGIYGVSAAVALAVMYMATIRIHQLFGRAVLFFLGVCIASYYLGRQLKDHYQGQKLL